MKKIKKIINTYSKPLPSSRSGPLFSAFPYPTKISTEAIAIFIATHTLPGDTILDPFGGSGSTGLAATLCSNPTPELISLAKKMNADVTWGPRKAILYEIGTLGSFVSKVMCSPPDEKTFLEAVSKLLSKCKKKLSKLYCAKDPDGNIGEIRYSIWSEIVECKSCLQQITFWEAAVKESPASIASNFTCPHCGFESSFNTLNRVKETYYDKFLKKNISRKKRILKKIYGKTGNKTWSRDATSEDCLLAANVDYNRFPRIPILEIPWGDLYRSGYHSGISHLHHFYTSRNLYVLGTVMDMIKDAPQEIQDALKFLVLSYNSSHSTMMSRVVVKSGQKDFVLTSSQPGVLYISNLPVEKNILIGLQRKANTIAKAFKMIGKNDLVTVVNSSSTMLKLPDQSIDYVFTDPPFGDFIPYSEVNFINEAWLGNITNSAEEVIISNAQEKGLIQYSKLINTVFKEVSRVLKNDGRMTLVFHSSKAKIWCSLQNALDQSNLKILYSSILDKLQMSFKQVNSKVSVKGDPLLLVVKGKTTKVQKNSTCNESMIRELIKQAGLSEDDGELTVERIYSRFISKSLIENKEVSINADEFYRTTEEILQTV